MRRHILRGLLYPHNFLHLSPPSEKIRIVTGQDCTENAISRIDGLINLRSKGKSPAGMLREPTRELVEEMTKRLLYMSGREGGQGNVRAIQVFPYFKYESLESVSDVRPCPGRRPLTGTPADFRMILGGSMTIPQLSKSKSIPQCFRKPRKCPPISMEGSPPAICR